MLPLKPGRQQRIDCKSTFHTAQPLFARQRALRWCVFDAQQQVFYRWALIGTKWRMGGQLTINFLAEGRLMANDFIPGTWSMKDHRIAVVDPIQPIDFGVVGDEIFFNSLKRFYRTWRFRKAGTEDLKAAFEAESHRSLDRFFERWIYSGTLPRLKFSYRTDGSDVVVRFEQVGDVFDVPVTITLNYASPAPPVDMVIALSEQVTEQRIPLKGVLKDVDVNSDNAAPVFFVK